MIKSIDSKVTPFGGIHLLHKRLISEGAVQFIDNELGRLKKFIFRLVNIVAKLTKSGRQQIIHLATQNYALIKLANTS